MFVLNQVQDHFYGYRIVNGVKFETEATFTRINKKRMFVKILVKCLDFQTSRTLYPNTRYPLMHQVRDMCRAGLLDRYINTDDKRHRYYYKTTKRGLDVIQKAFDIK